MKGQMHHLTAQNVRSVIWLGQAKHGDFFTHSIEQEWRVHFANQSVPGSGINNGKKFVDCGSCDCTEPCDFCFICQSGPNTSGACVVDPDLQRDVR